MRFSLELSALYHFSVDNERIFSIHEDRKVGCSQTKPPFSLFFRMFVYTLFLMYFGLLFS